MFRRLFTFAVLLAVACSTVATPAHACGGRGFRPSFRPTFRPQIRYSTPRTVVHTVVRPQTVIQPVKVQKVVVAPQPAKPALPTVPAGSTLTLPGNFLGNQPGDVFMVFGKIKLPVLVQAWKPSGVTITLPPMAIKTAVEVRLDVVLPSGKLGMTRHVRVTKPASVVLHPTAPTSPLPTADALQQPATPSAPAQPVVVSPLPAPVQNQAPVATQPIQIESAPSQPQAGSPLIVPSQPQAETNPILQEHMQSDATRTPNAPATSSPLSARFQLIGG